MFFTVEKIEKQLAEIKSAMYRGAQDIPRFKFMQSEDPQAVGEEAHTASFDDRRWADFCIGDAWGGYDLYAWFRAWVSIPEGWRQNKLALKFLVGPRDGGNSTAETLLYVNGKPLQAVDVWHEEAWLPPEYSQQDCILVSLRSWSGVLGVPDHRRFKLAQLLWIDEETERFYYACTGILRSVKTLDENDLRRIRLVQALNGAFHRVDFYKPKSQDFYTSVAEAGAYLREQTAGLESINELKPKVVGIGHAHIDLAWLWRLHHSREKAARTFSTALHLMRQYPEYRFLHSSPQLYKFIKGDNPEIYARVKDRIAAGQWEINGGMWVEADTNLPSGESLVRQFLLGRRYVRQEFGVEMDTLWLPDVFGYSWALPQIVKGCGMKYFLTSKISWSQFNRFPYDTFFWRGIDGTELLTYFVTTPEDSSPFYTYNGQLQPTEVKGTWDNYRQKDINDELLSLYGWGDGGGGPTREMLESARALKNLPGLPSVEMGKAGLFFQRLEQRLQGRDVPVWDGELYLEYHRGTYTSQAQNKRFNRKSEVLFHNAEWLSALADILTGQDGYPAADLQEGWELLLLNQFHDILPGSSIRQVYEDSREDYRRIAEIGEQAIEAAVERLAPRIGAPQESLLVMNPTSWKRDDLVELPWSEDLDGKTVLDEQGRPTPVQIAGQVGERTVLLEVSGAPALGYQVYPLVPTEDSVRAVKDARNTRRAQAARPAGQVPENEISIAPDWLENRYYRIRLNPQGQLTSLWDKVNDREVLAAGKRGNLFQAFEDKPMNFDAWDIDIYYQEKSREIDDLVEGVVEECGPLRGSLRQSWRFYDSRITQRIRIYRSSSRIDFVTEADWREQQVLLKVAFPVAVRPTRATYDIQFGSIERPTHWNTSWDYARFETVAHKWVDLSEGDYGVSLLNDCKYGHDVKDNVMRLTLIKSAIQPDETADQGKHQFTYSLLPHAGGWREGGVAKQAYALNNPLLLTYITASLGELLPDRFQLAEVDSANIVIETVKKAEDGDAWVIRLYENRQCHTSGACLRFGRPLRRALACNLVEEDEQEIAYSGETLIFSIAPYEIKTFKVWF